MCGRYAASASQDRLVEVFEIDEVPASDADALRPRWNIAPTDHVAAVVERLDKESGEVARKLVTPRWGLVPSWSKDSRGGARMVNARVETVADKPAFRKAFAARRCLLPADGYYEWYPLTTTDGQPVKRNGRQLKQPFFIHPSSADVPGGSGAQHALPGMMAMAGLYEFWRNPQCAPGDPDAWLTTCTVITTQATDALGHIHDRMPLQVARAQWRAWLDPHLTDAGAALELLHTPGPDEVVAHAVSMEVNSVAHDGPQLVVPIEGILETPSGAREAAAAAGSAPQAQDMSQGQDMLS